MGSRFLAPVVAALVVVPVAAGAGYRVTQIKADHGTVAYVADVNLAGQATGVMTDERGPTTLYRGFFYDPRTGITDIGDLGGGTTFASAINDRGVVTGSSRTADGHTHPFLFTPGVGMRDLFAVTQLDGSGKDVSNSGRVVGTLANLHAFEWTAAHGLVDLGPGAASGLSRTGTAFGFGLTEGGTTPGSWRRSRPSFEPLAQGAPGSADGGNIFDHAVGELTSTAEGGVPFFWNGRIFAALRPGPLRFGTGLAINDADEFVVESTNAQQDLTVPLFYPSPKAKPIRGDNLLPQGSSVTQVVQLASVNDLGILGGAGRVGSDVRGLVLTPRVSAQIATAGAIVAHQPVRATFAALVRRVVRAAGRDLASRCFELRALVRTLPRARSLGLLPAQQHAGAAALDTIALKRCPSGGIARAPVTIPYVFVRSGERVRASARVPGGASATIRVDFPAGAVVDLEGVRGETARTRRSLVVRVARVQSPLRFTLVARKLPHGAPAPVTAAVARG
jgi:probable HAF family extracellular repeat protein